MTTPRSDRLASLLRQEINEMLRRSLKDPRLEGAAVTRVELSADCRHARVLFTLLSDQSRAEQARDAFERAGGYVRRQLGRQLRLRQIPELRFVHDHVLHEATDVRLMIDRVVAEDRERQRERGETESERSGDPAETEDENEET